MAKKQRVLRICGKTSDRFWAELVVDGVQHKNHDGYVPEFFPEKHYGDYIQLDIDIDSGQILNWKKPTQKELDTQLNEEG